MGNFIEELKRRNVIKASISYVIIAWAVLQAVDILFPMFEVPDVFQKGIFITLIIGFPAFVIFAYVFESTPTGFKRTESVAPEKSIHKETSQKLNGYIIGGLIVAVLLLVADRQFDLAENITGEVEEEVDLSSIAVLPFDNLSGPDDEYFTAGVTEDILTHISKIKDLRVLSRFTLKEYDRAGKTIKQVGQELGVGYILTGSIRRAGDDLRISCQLVEINTEEETWAQNFDKEMVDVFAIQNEVATEVASYLKANLTEEEKAELSDRPTENLVSYNYYLKGREEYDKYEPAAMKKAIEYFSEATRLDPEFAEAYAGLANAYRQGLGYNILKRSYLDTAFNAARKAVKLDRNSPEALSSLAALFVEIGNNEEATTFYEKALEINPTYSLALANLANLWSFDERIDESIIAMKRMVEVNPISFREWQSLGDKYSKLLMFQEANSALQKAFKLNSDNTDLHYQMTLHYINSGELEKAVKLIQAMVDTNSNNLSIILRACDVAMLIDRDLAEGYALMAIEHPEFDQAQEFAVSMNIGSNLMAEGKKDSALTWLAPVLEMHLQQVEDNTANYITYYNLIQNYAVRGETEEALKWMRKDLDAGDLELVWLNNDRTLDGIREEPEFKAMIKEIEDKLRKMRLNLSAKESRRISAD